MIWIWIIAGLLLSAIGFAFGFWLMAKSISDPLEILFQENKMGQWTNVKLRDLS